MGLDMYLDARVSIHTWSNQDSAQNALKIQNIITQLDLPSGVIERDSGLSVNIPVAYWRKANAIHYWFVKNVQDGVDECRPFKVEREQLQELQRVCKIVLDARNDEEIAEATAEVYLPTTDGFFFGGTEYDEWYYNGIQYTYDKITQLLATDSLNTFEYCASW